MISTIIKLLVKERLLYYLGLLGVALLSIGVLFGLWTLQVFATEGGVVTDIALASIALQGSIHTYRSLYSAPREESVVAVLVS